MKTYPCPHCGLTVVVHGPCSWNHEHPACAQFYDLVGGGFEGFAARACEAFGTTMAEESQRQLNALVAPN